MAKDEYKTLSQLIRETLENKITLDDISKNQSYLQEIFSFLIKDIISEELKSSYKILEELFVKLEFIIYLLRSKNEDKFKEKLENFTTTFGDNLRTTL